MTARATTFLILSLLLCNSALAGNDSWTLRNNGFVLDVTEDLQSPYWIISTSGTDGASCGTLSSPCRNPQYAIDRASPGDAIYVREGTYTNYPGLAAVAWITLARGVSHGTAAQPITFRSYPGETATLDGVGVKQAVYIDVDYWNIENFTIVNTTAVTDNSTIASGLLSNNLGRLVTGVNVRGNHFLNLGALIDDTTCTSDDAGGGPVFINRTALDWVFENNWFHNSGKITDSANATACDGLGDSHTYRHQHHLYIGGKNIIVRNNVFTSARAGYAIRIVGLDSRQTDTAAGEYGVIMVNNTFGPTVNLEPFLRESDEGLAVRYFANSSDTYRGRLYIGNNVVLDPGEMRIQLLAEKGVNDALNDLIWDVDDDALGGDNPRDGSVCAFNMVEGPNYAEEGGINYCGENEFTEVTATGNTKGYTLSQFSMLDAANFDYRILSGSVADGACDSSVPGMPTTDYLGNARPSTPSCGAFEVSP